MPTPVSVARRCLTDEAARALDDAVAVARRRSHAQTTSLHAVSALLALPHSSLRESCARARAARGVVSYPTRLQFRALELSVGVSLDRLPTSRSTAEDEPPVSNSLMAAIKRSQANQRRQPESFHLQQIHAQNAAVLRVELKHLILSILDDPIVSRVFGEAGFRSCDIKMAVAHPPVTQASSRFAASRCPPIFLCNVTDNTDPTVSLPRSFRFPFPGSEDGESEKAENCRRIVEVLTRKPPKPRNPLLVGAGAIDSLRSFIDCVKREKSGNLGLEISGLCVIDIEKEVTGFVGEGLGKEGLGSKLEEVVSAVDRCSGPGVIVNVGEIKVLVSDGEKPSDEVSYVVAELKRLVEVHREKLWLIGAAGSEADLKFLAQFPTVEKDLDLHLLVLTWKPPAQRLYSKSSLMGSFVPFGGFFPTPSDFRNPVSSTNPSFTCCHLCSEKFEQEKAAVLKAGYSISVADQHSASLPSWLRMAELDTTKGTDGTKAKDSGTATALSTKILGLQKKWNDICQRVHSIQHYSKLDTFPAGSRPSVDEGFQVLGDGKQSSSKDSSRDEGPRQNEQEVSFSRQSALMPVVSEPSSVNFQCKLAESPKTRHIEMEGPRYPLHNSVATDLSLGTPRVSTSREPHKERLQPFSGSGSDQSKTTRSSSCSDQNTKLQLDPRDFKSLRGVLTEKVGRGRQDEAISAISQAVSRCRMGNARYRGSTLKGDIWLTFLGPDRDGKRRIASALAEAVFGSSDSLISIDMGCENTTCEPNSVFEELSGHDTKWGNTIVDTIAGELRKRPNSVVLLENVDKADLLARSSITQAIRTGKFSDSHGREVSINNMVFVTTASSMKGDKAFPSSNESGFSEERVLRAKSWRMQMQISFGSISGATNTNVRVASRTSNKRKLTDAADSGKLQNQANKAPRSGFDLNLPVEQTEDDDTESETISETSEAWLEDFLEQVDETVIFKPFDFDALAEKTLTHIRSHFQKTIGSNSQLEIDHQVMLQILAASWLSESKTALEKWIDHVLSDSFVEAQKRHDLSSQSVLRLVACEGEPVNERAVGICLPAKIKMN